MAAAIMRHLYGRFVYVDSAGARAGELDPMAVEVMEEIGIEIGKHKAQALRGSGRRVVRPDRHAVARSPSQGDGTDAHHGGRGRILADAGPDRLEGSREQRLDAYRAVRDELQARIEARFAVSLPDVGPVVSHVAFLGSGAPRGRMGGRCNLRFSGF
jgi:protein-tyrosine-phosphatase